MSTKTEKAEIELNHHSGLKLLVGLGEKRMIAWHRFTERQPASLNATFRPSYFGRKIEAIRTDADFAESKARMLRSLRTQPARTFGETLLALDKSRGSWTTLEELPDEVAIITGRNIGRFKIEDRATIMFFDSESLGPGTSPLFERERWLEAARVAEKDGRPNYAENYLQQATRFATTAAE